VHGQDQRSTSASDGPRVGPTVVFWLLAGGGVALMTLCLLAPAVQEYRRARAQRLRMAGHVEALRAQTNRQRRIIEALRSDPGANAQLAKAQLNYRAPDEVVVHTPMTDAPMAPVQPPQVPSGDSAVEPPSLAAQAERAAQRFGLIALAADPTARPVLMVLAAAALGAALFLFRR